MPSGTEKTFDNIIYWEVSGKKVHSKGKFKQYTEKSLYLASAKEVNYYLMFPQMET